MPGVEVVSNENRLKNFKNKGKVKFFLIVLSVAKLLYNNYIRLSGLKENAFFSNVD